MRVQSLSGLIGSGCSTHAKVLKKPSKKTIDFFMKQGEVSNHGNTRIADEILRQLGGGGKLKAMIGARGFLAIPTGLTFKYPRGKHLKISLNEKDLYDLTFGSIRGMTYKELKKFNNITVADLKLTIEDYTGLDLSL